MMRWYNSLSRSGKFDAASDSWESDMDDVLTSSDDEYVLPMRFKSRRKSTNSRTPYAAEDRFDGCRPRDRDRRRGHISNRMRGRGKPTRLARKICRYVMSLVPVIAVLLVIVASGGAIFSYPWMLAYSRMGKNNIAGINDHSSVKFARISNHDSRDYSSGRRISSESVENTSELERSRLNHMDNAQMQSEQSHQKAEGHRPLKVAGATNDAMKVEQDDGANDPASEVRSKVADNDGIEYALARKDKPDKVREEDIANTGSIQRDTYAAGSRTSDNSDDVELGDKRQMNAQLTWRALGGSISQDHHEDGSVHVAESGQTEDGVKRGSSDLDVSSEGRLDAVNRIYDRKGSMHNDGKQWSKFRGSAVGESG